MVDPGDIWAGILREASLGTLLRQPPRTTAVTQIISGSAFKNEAPTPPAKASEKTDLLGRKWLRRLSISSFRKAHTNIAFDFADVNLIVGANGAGKTSLLEAIEGLYCGRVRRDPSTIVSGVTGYVDDGKDGFEPIKATTATATLKARNGAWYRRQDFQASGISQGFARFNFLDTDAAFRLSASDDPAEIKDDLGKLLVGPESAKLWDYLSKLSDGLKPRLRSTASLRRNVQVARNQAERERRFAMTVASLAKYLSNLSPPDGATCIELQGRFKAALHEHGHLLDLVSALRDERTAALRMGLDWNAWQPKLQELQRLLPKTDLHSDDALAAELAQLAHLDAELSSLIEAEENRRDALNSKMQDLSSVVTIPLDGLALPQRLPVIERELASARDAQLAFDSLASQLSLLERQSVEWAESKVSACILGFERAKHALAGDQQAQATIKSKIEEHEKAKAALESTKAERDRLERACKVLSALTEQASLDQMTAQVFSSIRNKVSSIFARIHSPSEYELGDFTSGGLVVRRDGHAAHHVQQVSTGQRAALALSIFLALNDSADSAPPVMLIDDPVAHVDDLNALSFLDYLREVALRGRRQIFFATADVRLAALFQRKFEFLGCDHFRKIVLPREHAVGG